MDPLLFTVAMLSFGIVISFLLVVLAVVFTLMREREDRQKNVQAGGRRGAEGESLTVIRAVEDREEKEERIGK